MPSKEDTLTQSHPVETIRLWNGAVVPRIGLGTWAAGGMMIWPSGPSSYGSVSRDDAIAGIRLAHDLGVRIFDTAAAYGAGNAELILGEALKDKDDAVIVTKCGYIGDPVTRVMEPDDLSPAGIRRGVEGSLTRLGRSSVDAVILHHNELALDVARPIFDTLEAMRAEGLMTCYGWSSDHPRLVSAVADYPGFKVVEHDLNVFDTAPEMLALVEARGLYSLARMPLAMGLLSGKYGRKATLTGTDVRASSVPWLKYFKAGAANEDYLAILEKIAPLLTADDRSMPQGALAWVLGASERTIPIPGFTSAAQIRDNVEAVWQGRLSADAMARLTEIVAGG